jgi:hypothetical protein
MYSIIFVGIIFLFIESISGAKIQDNRIIIGSSVGGFLGLVSKDYIKMIDLFNNESFFFKIMFRLS